MPAAPTMGRRDFGGGMDFRREIAASLSRIDQPTALVLPKREPASRVVRNAAPVTDGQKMKCGSCYPPPYCLLVRSLRSGLKCLWMLVLAFWLPCTMHCSLEAAGLSFSECCSRTVSSHSSTDSQPSQSCEGCQVCSAVESGGYVKPVQSLELKPFVPVVWFVLWELLPPPPSTDYFSLRAVPPPEWPPSWRFVERVALPPRAPSCVS